MRKQFLDKLRIANRIPKKTGSIALAHALAPAGGVHSEFSIMREGAQSFYLVSAGVIPKRLDHDWIWRHMPHDGSVKFENLTNATGVLVVTGPKARELMARVSRDDFSNDAFRWLTARNVVINHAPCNAMRVNFVGELGWELHHPIEYQNHIFDALWQAGQDLGLKPFGIRAMDSMRIEKSYRMPGAELSIEYAALESGLHRFVNLNKSDFIGRDGLTRWQERGFTNAFVTLEVHDTSDADPVGNNPIYQDGRVVGRVTSGNYGFRLGKSLALAMVEPDLAAPGTAFEMDILGKRHGATIVSESPFDPDNERLRA